MAIAPKIKHVDQRPNGVLRFRRRFPKDVADHLGQPALQVHIRNTTGLAFHQEYQAILSDFDRIVSQTRAELNSDDTRTPIERWHDALLKAENLLADTHGLDDELGEGETFARHEIARSLAKLPKTDPLLIKALLAPEAPAPKPTLGDALRLYRRDKRIEEGSKEDGDLRRIASRLNIALGELQLTNEALGDDLEQLLEDADLDEAQALKVEREFAREYHLITRDDRLDAIASDLVRHFVGRGLKAKAMMVCIDKATAVSMHDKVREQWDVHRNELESQLADTPEDERPAIEAMIDLMKTTDMAVVVSQSQNEIKELEDKGLDIRPHRKRIVEEDLDERFKDANDDLRLVFVCAMWITGFDVPSCSTIYLDKPMKNHTLMQTIARANRNFPGKEAGFIVDYVGVFRNLQKALAIYGGGNTGSSEPPIRDKSDLVEYLRHIIAATLSYLDERGVDPTEIKAALGLEKAALIGDAVEKLIETDEAKRDYLTKARAVSRVYKAILPDSTSTEFTPDAVLISVLAERIRSLMPKPDISAVMQDVEDLLDRSVAPIPYATPDEPEVIDISQIDFDKLREQFDSGKKRTEAERLRALLSQKLTAMVARNPTRADFLERFQKLIDGYNNDSQNIEAFFRALIKLAEDLTEEELEAAREGLTEEEKAVFDILTKPEPELSEKERAQVKAVARGLLERLKKDNLVLDWRNKPQTKGAVRQSIEVVLDGGLPEIYDEGIFNNKCDAIYRHVYDAYHGGGQSVYAAA